MSAVVSLPSKKPHTVVETASEWLQHSITFLKSPSLVRDVGLTILNTVRLAAKVFSEQVPQAVAHTSLMFYRFFSILYLKEMAQELVKRYHDIHHAFTHDSRLNMIASAFKAMVHTIDTTMMVGVLAAAVSTVIGFPAVTLIIYQILRPIGLTTMIIEIGMDFVDYHQNKQLLNTFKQIKKGDTDIRIEQVMQHFLTQLVPKSAKEASEATQKEKRLAIRITGHFDVFTLNSLKGGLKEKFPSIKNEDLLSKVDKPYLHYLFEDVVKKTAQRYENINAANIFLRALGYISLGICYAKPETIASTSVIWGMGVLYLSKSIYKRFTDEKAKTDTAKGP